ncbi:MAG TPA: L,D-transpeptidase, partial [Polyangiaceae bacterium]|nr:L,D-transpeptidase [Polyangiaceae bacterium]
MLVSLRTVPLLFGVTLGLGCSTNDAEKAAQPQTTGPTEVGSASPDAAAPPPPKARPSSELPTPVSLSGEHRPGTLALVAPGRPRLYARALRVWIYERPSRSSRRLGYLRAGASSPTSAEPVSRSGCKAGWYPIEPRGFVCLGRRATLDANDPIVAATLEHPPDFSRKLPYIYGTVRRPGPVYARLPRREELLSAEPDIEERMRTWLTADGEIGAGYAQQVWLGRPGEVPDPARAWRERTTAGLPEFLRDHASVPNIYRKARSPDALVIEQMQPRVGHGFLRTFLHDGRRYGLST